MLITVSINWIQIRLIATEEWLLQSHTYLRNQFCGKLIYHHSLAREWSVMEFNPVKCHCLTIKKIDAPSPRKLLLRAAAMVLIDKAHKFRCPVCGQPGLNDECCYCNVEFNDFAGFCMFNATLHKLPNDQVLAYFKQLLEANKEMISLSQLAQYLASNAGFMLSLYHGFIQAEVVNMANQILKETNCIKPMSDK